MNINEKGDDRNVSICLYLFITVAWFWLGLHWPVGNFLSQVNASITGDNWVTDITPYLGVGIRHAGVACMHATSTEMASSTSLTSQ